MRIVLISEIFTQGMGYLENMLPKYLARLGARVDVVASSLPPDYRQGPEQRAYRDFAHGLPAGSVETVDGFRLHVLGHAKTLGHIRLLGLAQKLQELQPQVVQTMTPIGWIAIESAWNRSRLGYRLFSGCHYHASVFPLARTESPFFHPERLQCYLERGLHGRMASWATEKYYAISRDCAEVAAGFFGVPWDKVEVCPLGVDTEIFHPASGHEERAERSALRERQGFRDGEIVCIYSGRFTEDKNPLLLARAIAKLVSAGEPFRGLFIGNGPQATEIGQCRGSVTHSFMPMSELGTFYRAADLGVWPAQESLSMLDALACGIPLVANDTMSAPERLHGTGLQYRLGDVDDLVLKLRSLGDAGVRKKLAAEGARRMREEFSWEAIAARRLEDYSAALGTKEATAAKPTAEKMLKKASPARPSSQGAECE
jgi:glycosyltransferase involved in cell wall biosynthesis